MLVNKSISHGFFIVVKQAKLEVVDFLLFVKIDFVENQPIVRQSQIDAHFAHAEHEFSKIEGAIKIFIETPKCLRETLELLVDSIVYVLEEDIDPAILLRSLHQRQSLERVVKVRRSVMIVWQRHRTVLKDIHDVDEVLVA